MTEDQLGQAIMQLALAVQTLSYVTRMMVSPIDEATNNALDLAQSEVNEVMASLARNGVPRATSEGE